MISKIVRTSYSVAKITGTNISGTITGLQESSYGLKRITESILNDNKLSIVLDSVQNKQNGMKFLNSLALSVIYLNNDCIGKVFYQKVNDRPQPTMCIEFANSPLIDIYNIGIGNRFIFFYSQGRPVGCAHHDNNNQFTIFANDEWYTQIIATYICTELLYGDGDYAISFVTPDNEVTSMYDGNYISELIKDEPIEIKKLYSDLIHEKKQQEEVVKKAQKENKKSLIKIMLFVLLFFIFAIGLTFATEYSDYKNVLNSDVYQAKNMNLDGSHVSIQGSLTIKMGLDIQYQYNGKIVSETIYVDKPTYYKYKDVEEFDLRIIERKDEDGHKYYDYYIGDVTLLNTINYGIIIVLFIVFLLFEGLLCIPIINNMKHKKKLDNKS